MIKALVKLFVCFFCLNAFGESYKLSHKPESISFCEKITESPKPYVAVNYFWLGLCHFEGLYVEHNRIQGLQYLIHSAKQGYEPAQELLNLIRVYDVSDGIKSDGLLSWHILAAEEGSADSQYEIGALYSSSYQIYRYRGGKKHASFEFSLDYDLSEGIPTDYGRSAFWLTRAAEQGHVMASYMLASLYDAGLGVSQDYQRAAELYKVAAENNVTNAQHNLGYFHFKGLGVAKDLRQAYVWLSRAANRGKHTEVLDDVISEMSQENLDASIQSLLDTYR